VKVSKTWYKGTLHTNLEAEPLSKVIDRALFQPTASLGPTTANFYQLRRTNSGILWLASLKQPLALLAPSSNLADVPGILFSVIVRIIFCFIAMSSMMNGR
jgi:hypothetical protein